MPVAGSGPHPVPAGAVAGAMASQRWGSAGGRGADPGRRGFLAPTPRALESGVWPSLYPPHPGGPRALIRGRCFTHLPFQTDWEKLRPSSQENEVGSPRAAGGSSVPGPSGGGRGQRPQSWPPGVLPGGEAGDTEAKPPPRSRADACPASVPALPPCPQGADRSRAWPTAPSSQAGAVGSPRTLLAGVKRELNLGPWVGEAGSVPEELGQGDPRLPPLHLRLPPAEGLHLGGDQSQHEHGRAPSG